MSVEGWGLAGARARAASGGKAAFRLLWGESDERRLRPLLVVSVLTSFAFSTFWSYTGVFAVEGLGATAGQIGFMFLVGSALAAASSYLAGHLSDRIGRKGLIVAAAAAEAALIALLPIALDNVELGFALIWLIGAVSAPAWALPSALVADLIPEGGREGAYAAVRVANNLGVVLGPPSGGLLLLLGGWPAFLFGVAALGGVAALVALRVLPSPAPVRADAEARIGSLGLIGRDRPFLLLLASQLLAFVVYVAFETVLPVIAVSSLGLAASTWGFLVVINPILVTLFQLRLTRRVEHVSPAVKLAVAIPLMGFPFLLLLVSGSVPMIAAVVLIFVLGEMLWIPTSQTLAARLAPEHARGAYLGAFGAVGSVAWMVAPLVSLQLREVAGDAAVWLFFATISLAAAAGGVAASHASPRLAHGAATPAPAVSAAPTAPPREPHA